MPRQADPPRLERDRKGSGIWYIRYRQGRSREQSTGTRSREEAEKYFGQWLRDRGQGINPGHPHEVTIDLILANYAEEHAPHTQDAERIPVAVLTMPVYGPRRTY